MLLALSDAKNPWFWGTAAAVAAVLLLLNVLLIVAVHGRRIRQIARSRRQQRFRARFEEVLADVTRPGADGRDWLRRHVYRFDELERPLAAAMLIERLRPASDDERAEMLAVLRDVGGIDLLLGSTSSWMPWRRALAMRTLGWVGADESVPLLIERASSDHFRHVRESAVRALGRIGDRRALQLLDELFRSPDRVGAGVVYDALVAFGAEAEPVFAGALGSENESVRVASCFGVAATSAPEVAAKDLEPLLTDSEPLVRAAAAESLGHIGGALLPEALALASRDDVSAVRKSAARALGFYDDPRCVAVAVTALRDPDRDTAIRAAESLVRLSRAPLACSAAADALTRCAAAWPVQRALIFDSLGTLS